MSTPEYEQAVRPMCTLTKYEKETRAKFVEEYLKDYNPVKAAMRVGYSNLFARDFAERFMLEPYTLQLIAEAECGGSVEGELDEEKEKRRVLKALWREANNMGHGSTASSRVAALAKISAIYGMDAPTKSNINVNNTNDAGVFVVPGIMNEEQWTAQAAKQQEDLQKPTSPPQLKAVS